MKFIVDHWAQISFMLLAFGYVIKIILESVFKRKEIRFNFFLNNRMKAIEKFLSDYSNLQTNYSDTITSYINKVIGPQDVDNVILPLRYKLQDSLATLELYTTQHEYAKFEQVFSNIVFLMNQVRRLKWEPQLGDIEKGNELSSLLRQNEGVNAKLLKEVLTEIRKNFGA